jgi:hypothetical protein
MNDAHFFGNNIMCIEISFKLGLPWARWVLAQLVIFSLRVTFEVAVNKPIDARSLLCNF